MKMSISARLVMQLRERTGAGMMECKKFLIATNGDIEAAITEMRKAGQAKASKKAGRTAAEGVVIAKLSADARRAIVVEINSETDFVARDAGFRTFADEVVACALSNNLLPNQESDQAIEQAFNGEPSFVETNAQNAKHDLGPLIPHAITITAVITFEPFFGFQSFAKLRP